MEDYLICVEVKTANPFPNNIPLINEYGLQDNQQVEYECIHSHCKYCGKFRHYQNNCPTLPKKKWVPKTEPNKVRAERKNEVGREADQLDGKWNKKLR